MERLTFINPVLRSSLQAAGARHKLKLEPALPEKSVLTHLKRLCRPM